MRHAQGLLLTTVGLLSATGCDPNYVQPGFYAALDAGERVQSDDSPATHQVVDAAITGARPVETVTAGSASAVGASGANTSGSAGSGGAAASAPHPASTTTNTACDLTGRWLVTNKYVLDGLGQLQTTHNWLYYEIKQSGDKIVIAKGLSCGEEVVPDGALGAFADTSSSWPTELVKTPQAGRTGTSQTTSAGCKVSLEKWVTTKGATLPYYDDLSHTLPTADQQAMGTAPGWEDWDQDGKPGITVVTTGTVSGKVYVCSRTWHTYSGVVADASHTFTLSDDWNQNVQTLGYDGSVFLTTMAVRASDATLHIAQFARLSASQATGDDAAICASIRSLAPMLTPQASAK